MLHFLTLLIYYIINVKLITSFSLFLLAKYVFNTIY
jgi:hypothetical protein